MKDLSQILKIYQKLVYQTSLISQKTFNKNSKVVQKKKNQEVLIKEVLNFKKQTYSGLCILDLSKAYITFIKTKSQC